MFVLEECDGQVDPSHVRDEGTHNDCSSSSVFCVLLIVSTRDEISSGPSTNARAMNFFTMWNALQRVSPRAARHYTV